MNRLDDPMGNNVDPYTLIMFQPSYSTGRAPDTAAQRIAANNGGTLAVFHMSLFVRSESCSGDADLCCLLFDSQANSGEGKSCTFFLCDWMNLLLGGRFSTVIVSFLLHRSHSQARRC